MYSGNDAATAIAEYVGGSEEAFVNMMNRRAQELMANGTHFMNPHGLHDDNHYTTAYDLYLIFNECIKHEDFVNIIQSEAYTAYYTDVDGNSQEALFTPTNLYAQGEVDVPENEEGPSMGGAMLAAVGCGEYPDVETICNKLVRVVDTVEPEPELVAKYEEKYRKFRKLYPAMKELFR